MVGNDTPLGQRLWYKASDRGIIKPFLLLELKRLIYGVFPGAYHYQILSLPLGCQSHTYLILNLLGEHLIPLSPIDPREIPISSPCFGTAPKRRLGLAASLSASDGRLECRPSSESSHWCSINHGSIMSTMLLLRWSRWNGLKPTILLGKLNSNSPTWIVRHSSAIKGADFP